MSSIPRKGPCSNVSLLLRSLYTTPPDDDLPTLEAWHVVHSTDPLEDSDQEADDHTRQDLSESRRFTVPLI